MRTYMLRCLSCGNYSVLLSKFSQRKFSTASTTTKYLFRGKSLPPKCRLPLRHASWYSVQPEAVVIECTHQCRVNPEMRWNYEIETHEGKGQLTVTSGAPSQTTSCALSSDLPTFPAFWEKCEMIFSAVDLRNQNVSDFKEKSTLHTVLWCLLESEWLPALLPLAVNQRLQFLHPDCCCTASLTVLGSNYFIDFCLLDIKFSLMKSPDTEEILTFQVQHISQRICRIKIS